MEVGPTCHYVMGGVEVDPDTAAAGGARACSRPARCSGGMHGSNRLGGNSLSDLLVFGRRAGAGAADVRRRARRRAAGGRRRPTSRPRAATALAPFERRRAARTRTRCTSELQQIDERPGRHHPHARRRWSRRWSELDELRGAGRAGQRRGATGSSTPAGTSRSTCATCCWSRECVAQAALERQESRGGHTRDDFPAMEPEWRKVNLVCSLTATGRRRRRSPSSRCRRCGRTCSTCSSATS